MKPKTIIWIAFFLVFLAWQFLNFTGFCYRERRYLSRDELINIAILNVVRRDLPWGTKDDVILKYFNDRYGKNSYEFSSEGFSSGHWVFEFIGTLFSNKRYTVYFKNTAQRDIVELDACGQVRQTSGGG